MNINFALVALLMFLFSCSHNTSNNEVIIKQNDSIKVKKTYYSNGNLWTEQQFKADTIQHGYYRRYHMGGKVAIEIPYKEDKKHGKVKEYDINGTLRHTECFKNGLPHGLAEWYSEKGQLIASSNYKDGKRVGEAYMYDEAGFVKAYIYFNQLNEVRYRVDYKEGEKIIKEEGTGFPNVLVNTDKLYVGDTLEAELNIINPPHASSLDLYIGELNESGVLINKVKVAIQEGKYI